MASPLYSLTAPATAIFLGQEVLSDNSCYNTAEVIELPSECDLDVLRKALQLVYTEHEQLRVEIVLQDGGVYQRLLSDQEFSERIPFFPETDEYSLHSDAAEGYLLPAEVANWALELQRQPLDLYRGQTVRSAAVRFGGKLWLFHSFHHLVADGFAAFSLLSQLLQKYRTLSEGKNFKPRVKLTLADLVEIDETLQNTRSEQTQQWLTEVQTDDPAYLDFEDSTVAGRISAASPITFRRSFEISAPIQEKLLRVAQRYEVSWPVVLTALTGHFLNRTSGNRKGSFAVPQMNRVIQGSAASWGRAASQTACTAVSMLPVRIGEAGSLGDQLHSVSQQISRNQKYALARAEDLERLADTAGGRLYGAQINVVPFDSVLKLRTSQAKIHNINAGPVTDMTVCFRGRAGNGQSLVCEIDVNPGLYDETELVHLANRLEFWIPRWLDAAVSNETISKLSLCTHDDVARLEHYNTTAKELEYKNLVTRFIEQVAQTPNAPALIASSAIDSSAPEALDFSRILSYKELDERARSLATRLIKRGIRPGDAIGLRVERSIEQYVLLYSLLYVGAIYVPILPELPADRVRSMIEDAHCVALLESPGVVSLENEIAIPTHSWESIGQNLEAESAADDFPGLHTELDETAYILFTSGSTGRPKGVPISHRAIDNRLLWQQSAIPVRSGKRVLHKTPISFDVHVWEIYWPLAYGAAIVIAAPHGQKDPVYLAQVVQEQKVTCLHFVPTMFSAFLNSRGAQEILDNSHSLEAVVCSGEVLTLEHVERCRSVLGVSPLNLYGPTEAAIDVTYFDTSQIGKRQVVPIGYPVWNTTCSVVDLAGQVVPPGVVGELVLHGVQLAQGYQNNPSATAKAFGANPATGENYYRTGDLAVWGEDGALYYRGRRDYQVKIRGQRLELGEIESVLASLQGVANAVVGVRTDTGEPALAAYLETDMPREEIIEIARTSCEEHLPDYMVPAFWFVLSEFPLGASGKADRKTLNSLELNYATGASLPSSYTEQILCEIFAEVTGLPSYEVDEDFFKNGGSSLSALQLIGLIEQRLAVRLSIASLFAHPTPRDLSQNFVETAGDELKPVLFLRKLGNADKAFVFLPPAGGLSWCYSSFLASIPEEFSVIALQAPQIADYKVAFPRTLSESAQYYAQQIVKLNVQHVCLVGWSVGGTIAPEVASLLAETDISIEGVAVLDGYPTEDWSDVPVPDEEESYKAILRMGAVPENVDNLTLERTIELLQESGSALGQLDGAVLTRCIESMRATSTMLRDSKQSYFDGKIDVFIVEHPDQQYLSGEHWQEYGRSVKVQSLAGEHLDLVRGTYPSMIVGQMLGVNS